MKCPFCGCEDTQVKDSRNADDNTAILAMLMIIPPFAVGANVQNAAPGLQPLNACSSEN